MGAPRAQSIRLNMGSDVQPVDGYAIQGQPLSGASSIVSSAPTSAHRLAEVES